MDAEPPHAAPRLASPSGQETFVKFVVTAFLAFLAALAAGPRHSAAEGLPGAPRLVVVVAIDQFREDYLTRFSDLYRPAQQGRRVGGFRYFQYRGAWYPDCEYRYHRTVTAAGHAVLGSGAWPWANGIVGNSWWDASTGKSVYCVADPKAQVVGAQSGSKETPMSAANLLVTTVGDELELATGGRARTVALALKDRGAILLAGHRADAVIWFDEDTGGWVSSTAYARDGKLPAWVEELNARKLPEQARSGTWKPTVDAKAMARVWSPGAPPPPFAHSLAKDYVTAMTSPAGNAYVFETARQAVRAEGLGRDEIPDILSINLSTNDYVGHRFGPDSAEVLDLCVQTDREFSEFLNFLQATVPGGLARVTFAVSADHGVSTIPELNAQSGVPAARSVGTAIRAAAEKALDDAVGPGDWIVSVENGELYFGEPAVARYPRTPRSRMEALVIDAIRNVPGVLLSVGKTAVLEGKVPQTELGRRLSPGVHPRRSGDVIVVLDPNWLPGSAPTGTGASHGSLYTHDANVPLLVAGAGIRPGVYQQPVTPAQLAPSLSFLLGVARPSAALDPLLPGLQSPREE